MGDVNWRGVVDTLRASAPPPRQDQDIASWHHSTAAHSLADAIEANLIPLSGDSSVEADRMALVGILWRTCMPGFAPITPEHPDWNAYLSDADRIIASAINGTLFGDDDTDYREIFGKNPDRWRVPLGALLLTLADETAPPWQLARARDEAEELKRVLNEMVGAPLPPRRVGEAGS